MNWNAYLIVWCLLLKLRGEAKVYDRCELARELVYSYKVPLTEAALWVCIAFYESSFNSAAVGRLNHDGSSDHGLFQFSDRWWCGRSGQIPCQRLRDNNLYDDLYLARKVWRAQGLKAWVTFPKCRSSFYRFLSHCF